MIRWILPLLLVGFAVYSSAEELEATVDWSRPVILSVPVSGVVQSVAVAAGDRVSRGQILLSLDPRGFQAAVDGAQARLDRTEPQRLEAEREVERSEELYEIGALSDHELELTRIASAQTDAEYRIAKAALTQAMLDLEYSILRAPFDGLVLERHVTVGETVVTRTQSVPLITLVRAGYRRAEAVVSAELAQRLLPGSEVRVRVGQKRFQAVLEALRPQTAPASGTGYRAVAVFSVSADEPVYPGQRVILELP